MKSNINRYFLASIFLWPLIWLLISIVIKHINSNIDQHTNKNLKNKNKSKEGFISYTDCINNGYTKEFCVNNPMGFPGVCRCDNGQFGMILPEFRGECVCPTRFF